MNSSDFPNKASAFQLSNTLTKPFLSSHALVAWISPPFGKSLIFPNKSNAIHQKARTLLWTDWLLGVSEEKTVRTRVESAVTKISYLLEYQEGRFLGRVVQRLCACWNPSRGTENSFSPSHTSEVQNVLPSGSVSKLPVRITSGSSSWNNVWLPLLRQSGGPQLDESQQLIWSLIS